MALFKKKKKALQYLKLKNPKYCKCSNLGQTMNKELNDEIQVGKPLCEHKHLTSAYYCSC